MSRRTISTESMPSLPAVKLQPMRCRSTGTATRPVLDLGGLHGLSADDAWTRRLLEGPNELPAQKPRSLFAIGFEVAREPMFLMLVAAMFRAVAGTQEAVVRRLELRRDGPRHHRKHRRDALVWEFARLGA